MRYILALLLTLNTLPGLAESFGQSFGNSFASSVNSRRSVYLITTPIYVRVPTTRSESLRMCPFLQEEERELKSLVKQATNTEGFKSFRLKAKVNKLQKRLYRKCYSNLVPQ
jgi:hypothetical protein